MPGSTPSVFVTTVAWTSIVLSGLTSLIGLMQNLFIWFLPRIDVEKAMAQGGDDAPTLFLWMAENIQWIFLFFWLMALSVLVSSVGLLKRKPWSLGAFTAMLYVGILWSLSSFAVMVSVLASAPTFREGPPMFQAIEASIVVFNFIFMAALVGLFAWLIRRLSAPAVKAEFAQP